MAGSDPKGDLHRYLQAAREALLWKLDGLSEYDIRRPMVPTGTNLLGLIKHVARVESGYFGDTFGRPFDEPQPWFEDGAEPNADMWATAADLHSSARAEVLAAIAEASGPGPLLDEALAAAADLHPHSRAQVLVAVAETDVCLERVSAVLAATDRFDAALLSLVAARSADGREILARLLQPAKGEIVDPVVG
jgi:hypothetical protein